MVCHAEYESEHRVACDFTNEIVFPALKSAKSCQTVNIVHLSEQKVIIYSATITPPWYYYTIPLKDESQSQLLVEFLKQFFINSDRRKN